MKPNLKKVLFGEKQARKAPVLLAVTPPRTGERTLLGVENLLQSIAVPEPFSLELAGDTGGVTLLARCQDDRVVRSQIAAHYPQARIRQVPVDEDPIFVHAGEQSWGLTLRVDGPEYVPLRTFRDDDLLDPGSDPLLAVIGSLSALRPGERVLARLLLRSLGPDWSQAHRQKAFKNPGLQRPDPSYTYQTKPLQLDGVTMAVLGAGALAALKGYLWVQDGEYLKAFLLASGTVLGLVVGGWGWWRWKQARSRVYDPLLIKEKVGRIAFEGELQVVAVLPGSAGEQRARELLEPVAAAYRHYDHPAGARFRVSKVSPLVPLMNLHPAGPGLFGKRSILGVREAAALWHPPGERDETPLVERSGSRALLPSARSVSGGALVGATTAGTSQPIRFPEDLLRRHHLYVARTRMGKSTLMHHIVTHKLREKAEGRDGDAIVVVDPHADLVAGILEHVPESLIDRVRLIDLADESRSPGINLLDTRVFADRDRTADSVVRVARGLWEQWGPRMQSILEQTVKTLHEANEQVEADRQHTILDGLKLLSNEPFRNSVLAKVSDPYLLEWWARDFGGWHRQYRAEALAPVQTRLSYYASSKRAQGHPGPVPLHHRPAGDHPGRRSPAGVHLPGDRGPGRGRPGGGVAAQPGGLGDKGAGEPALFPAARRAGGGGRDAVHARRGLRVDVVSELGKFGASFILATQSLAKLEDLSTTMRDTILANVGCLAVFQVAGSDARQLVWELGKDRVSEDDIVSLDVHHCYVRATVGTERMPAFSMMVRKPEDGDPAVAARIRAAATAYTRSAREVSGISAAEAEGEKKVSEYRRLLAEGHNGAEPRGEGQVMSPAGCEAELLRMLAWTPFLDRPEMVCVSGRSRGAVYEAVGRLEQGGLVDSIPHAADLTPPARRYCLTAAGVRRLAEDENTTLDGLLRSRPVSQQWRRILLERLDAVASVYRLASTVAVAAHPIAPAAVPGRALDAALLLPGGKTVGVVRQGPAADRTAFAKRLWRLGQGPLPGAVLILTSDEVRLRHARRLLARTPVNALLALERDAVLAGAAAPVWRPPSGGARLDLGYVLERLRPGGELREEEPPSRASLPGDLAADAARALPALLKPAEKRVLDLLAGLALDVAEGPGRTAGRLGDPGLPAGEPAGRVRPRDPLSRRRRPPGPRRPGAGLPVQAGPRLGGRGPQALERQSHRPRRPRRVAQRLRQPEPPVAPQPGSHRRRPPLHGGPGPPVPRPGLGDRPTRPAPPGLQVLPSPRRPALGQPRRLRRPPPGPGGLALFPGVGAPRRAARNHVPAPGALPALLLLPPAHRRPRRQARRPGGLRRRHRRHPLSDPGGKGDGTVAGGRAPVGVEPEDHRGPGAAGPGLAHPRRLGTRPSAPERMNDGPGREHFTGFRSLSNRR